jgi:tRNA 2-selenouridine synthase SelU
MSEETILRLVKDVPMIRKGLFKFCNYSSEVYWYDKKEGWSQYSLRQGLAGYLWLLRYEKGYFRKVKDEKPKG